MEQEKFEKSISAVNSITDILIQNYSAAELADCDSAVLLKNAQALAKLLPELLALPGIISSMQNSGARNFKSAAEEVLLTDKRARKSVRALLKIIASKTRPE